MSCRQRKLELVQRRFEQRRNIQNLHEAWPLGKLLNPLFKRPLSLCRQMVDDTNVIPCDNRSPNPPTVVVAIFVKSASQRLSRSGLGLPNKFFIPSVNKKVVARANASPSQPACHSQSLSLYITDLGVPLPTLGPGTEKRHMRKMTTAGVAIAIAANAAVEICSLATSGNDISGLVRSKGRW